MNLFSISRNNLRAKPLSTTLSLILFATGISIISIMLLVTYQIEEKFKKNIANIDLVVGAKGSPLQLILSSVFHVDYPTGNILKEEADLLNNHPYVDKTIPLALGDNYRSFRIVGTTHDYLEIYEAGLKEGTLWKEDLEVTVGSDVAADTKLKIGDTFTGVHGFIENIGHHHDEFAYRVTGILRSTGTVTDQLIFTNIQSIWKVHGGHSEDHDIEDDDDPSKEITSLLVFIKNPMGVVQLPRLINENTNMQAAVPAFEINRLFSLMGIGIDTISILAYFIIFISGLSIFISMLNSLKERKYELALMRVLGSGKTRIFIIIILEGLMLSVAGFITGLFISHLGLQLVGYYFESSMHYSFSGLLFVTEELYLFIGTVIVGFLASVIPAVKGYMTNISETLAEA